MNIVERVAEAGNPLNPAQLKVLLAGCDIQVTAAEAEWLFTLYCRSTEHQPHPYYAVRS